MILQFRFPAKVGSAHTYLLIKLQIDINLTVEIQNSDGRIITNPFFYTGRCSQTKVLRDFEIVHAVPYVLPCLSDCSWKREGLSSSLYKEYCL